MVTRNISSQSELIYWLPIATLVLHGVSLKLMLNTSDYNFDDFTFQQIMLNTKFVQFDSGFLSHNNTFALSKTDPRIFIISIKTNMQLQF